jgi:superfamily I DNA/RNA helicase
MTFLHPYQAKLVRRTFNGPARIRGAAGTGKTVVGLHRAAYLARAHPTERVLFTTFVKTLPAVMSNLLRRMEPGVADRVDFVHVHGFAREVLRERGIPINLNGRKAKDLWSKSWATLPDDHKSRLCERAGTRDAEYWREEVQDVIKGRGLVTFEAYAECARPGRAIRLNMEDRRSVWALHRAYDLLLREAGIDDFHDLVLRAESAIRARPWEGYAAVIVDEAQDLSLSAVRMLHSLVGDATDAFTLIGDGQQSIYPGGYVLSEAGISLAGRGVVLDINYRNTLEIQRFANDLVAASSYTDIDDDTPDGRDASVDGDVGPLEQRHGPAPSVQVFSTRRAHNEALVARVRNALSVTGVGRGDIAILCDTNGQARDAEALLMADGIPTLDLLRYDGLTSDAVKVGTIKRAKGLEFKAVLLPWTPASWRSAPDDERAARCLRERYVAATRARDLLWVGCIAG